MTDTWQRAARHALASRSWWLLERDDARQIADLAAWRASERWRPDGGQGLFGYCRQAAVWALADAVRDAYRRPVPIDEWRADGAVWNPEPDDLARAVDAIAATPVERRTCEILALGFTAADIARADGVTQQAVSHRIRAIRARAAAA